MSDSNWIVLRCGVCRGGDPRVLCPTLDKLSPTYLKAIAYPLRDSDGNVTGVVELRRDVTAERELESQLLRRHHQLLALSRVSGAISGLRDLDAILRVTLDNALELVDSDIGGILFLDEDTETRGGESMPICDLSGRGEQAFRGTV